MKNIQLDHSSHKAAFKRYPVCFLANDIDIPVNVGSLFRIADALGVEKIYLTGNTPAPPDPKIKKTSRSAEKYVPYEHKRDALAVLRRLKESGYKIVSLEITSKSISIEDFCASGSGSEKICLVLGSENKGICRELLDASDFTIHIPMLGNNSSMNVANACSIAAYEIIKGFKNTDYYSTEK